MQIIECSLHTRCMQAVCNLFCRGTKIGEVTVNKAPLFSLAKNKNRAEEAYLYIKNSIIHNDFKPGDCLSENAIAQSLGMSRTPVREAFKVLVNEGYIETRNGIGAFVRHITAKEIHDIFEVRAALECAAVETALARISDKELEEIEKTWMKFESDVNAGVKISWEKLSELDYRLHEFLIMKCENDYIINILNDIRMKIAHSQATAAITLGDQLGTIKQHLHIIRLIKNRDADELRLELRAHIQRAADLIFKNPSLRF